jgi:hypothetical protein
MHRRAATPLLAASLALAALLAAPRAASAQALGGNAIGVSLTTNTLSTGTVLSVGGAVSPDGRYVTLSVQPTFASLEGFDTYSSGGVFSQTTAAGLHAIPFRPAVVGKVTVVENDKKLLGKSLKPTALKDISLKAAARKLADAADANLVLGIRGLEQAGVDVNAPHTFTLPPGGTLKDALLAILQSALPEQDMVITADDGVVQVVTQAQADNTVVTRTYYLDDLLANLPRVVPNTMDLGTLRDDKTPAAAAAPKPVARAATPARPVPAKHPPPKRPAANSSAADVLRLITASVRPEIWKMNGGKIGEISLVGDRVIVTAPQSVHAILDGPRHHDHNAVPMYIGVHP